MSAAPPRVAVCPRDGAQLVEVERDGVTIDACPKCRGIWLDRGELEQLIAEAEVPGSDDGFLDEVTGRHARVDRIDERVEKRGRARKRRRGSFLENFLDLGGD
jgi:Zn-finger nucleic acid-binding protein